MAENGYAPYVFRSSPFQLYSAFPQSGAAVKDGALQVVIEGDGYAWVTSHAPSENPTPKNPVGLKLAMGLGAVYLARPCQYYWQENICGVPYWTDRRFDPDVIKSVNEALDILKDETGAAQFDLVGFSGGAYIAFAMAATRLDIRQVTTVAGVLDPDAWTKFLEVSPLKSRYRLQDLLQQSKKTQFIHYCSPDDDIVACNLAQITAREAAAMGLSNHRVIPIPGEGHESLWEKALPMIQKNGIE